MNIIFKRKEIPLNPKTNKLSPIKNTAKERNPMRIDNIITNFYLPPIYLLSITFTTKRFAINSEIYILINIYTIIYIIYINPLELAFNQNGIKIYIEVSNTDVNINTIHILIVNAE